MNAMRLTVLSCAALAAFTIGTLGAAAQLENPVKATAMSIADGRKVFSKNCVSCHGEGGRGDGKAAALLNPMPSDLTSGNWNHGASDGDIFTVIKDGSKGTAMKGFASKLTATDIWNVVNYVRSIGPPLQPSH